MDPNLERELTTEYFKTMLLVLRGEITERINSIQRLSSFVGTGVPALLVFIVPVYPSIDSYELAPLIWLLPSLLLVPGLLLSTADRTAIAQIALYLMQNVEHAAEPIRTGVGGILGYETWLQVRRSASFHLPDAAAKKMHVANLRDLFEDLGMVAVYFFFLSLCAMLTLCFTWRPVPIDPNRPHPAPQMFVHTNASPAAAANPGQASPSPADAPAKIAEKDRAPWAVALILVIIAVDFGFVLLLCHNFRWAMDCIVDPPEPITTLPGVLRD